MFAHVVEDCGKKIRVQRDATCISTSNLDNFFSCTYAIPIVHQSLDLSQNIHTSDQQVKTKSKCNNKLKTDLESSDNALS